MPGETRHVQINESVAIPLSEIRVEFAHSSGPGGQNVNKVASQVTVCFAVAKSRALTTAQKQRICSVLANRINRDGILRVVSHRSRHQAQNRILALSRLGELLAAALRRPRRRHATRPTKGANERRLKRKKQHSAIKRARGPVEW